MSGGLLPAGAAAQLRPATVGSPVSRTAALLRTYFNDPAQVRPAAVRRGPRKSTQALMDEVHEVLDDFDGSMSTRQVYYQLVSRGAVENNDRSYDKVQRLLVQMRRDGEVPYDRIVDRNRARHMRPGWDGARDLMEAAALQFRRDYWADQENVVMIALEKAALEGVFAEAVDEYGAQLWTIRGFNSESFAFEWANEIKRLQRLGKWVHVHYYGDFDPSGIALEHDAANKLESHGARFSWSRRGLLLEDFERYGLVRVPVKASDSRTKRYLKTFGDCAAELDALDPDTLRSRVRQGIERHINTDAWERVQRDERVQRESLDLVVKSWDDVVSIVQPAARL